MFLVKIDGLTLPFYFNLSINLINIFKRNPFFPQQVIFTNILINKFSRDSFSFILGQSLNRFIYPQGSIDILYSFHTLTCDFCGGSGIAYTGNSSKEG